MSLQDWLKNGWLTEHKPSRQETRDLLGVADRDLADCAVPGLSADWRLNIAYNAALQLATAAMAAAGYRPARESHHYRVIQSLAHTVGANDAIIGRLDQFRKKRNIGGYERAGLVSDAEVHELIGLARDLRVSVERWIKETHPSLL